MIGVESPSNPKLFYGFNLEKKVRKNYPLWKLKEILNLDFMSGGKGVAAAELESEPAMDKISD